MNRSTTHNKYGIMAKISPEGLASLTITKVITDENNKLLQKVTRKTYKLNTKEDAFSAITYDDVLRYLQGMIDVVVEDKIKFTGEGINI